MDTVDIDSARKSNYAIDLDKFRNVYTKKESDIQVTFISPYITDYEHNRLYLLKNSIKKVLNPKYYYRPDYLAHAEYGNTTLWAMLMYINNIRLIEHFNVVEVYIPTYDSITTMLRRSVTSRTPRDLDDVLQPIQLYPKIYEHIKFPEYTSQNDVEDEVDIGTYERETFTLKEKDLINMYVELKKIPSISSLVMRLQNEVYVPLYDVHYVLTESDNGYNRITWNPNELSYGDGLIDVVLIDTVMEIQYKVENE